MKSNFGDDVRFAVRIFLIFYVSVFLASRVYHFYHGYMHGMSSQPRQKNVADLCKNNPALREEIPEKCEHLISMGDFGPIESGWMHVYNNTFLCVFQPCSEAIKSVGGVLLLSGLFSMIIAYFFFGIVWRASADTNKSGEQKRLTGSASHNFMIEEVKEEGRKMA